MSTFVIEIATHTIHVYLNTLRFGLLSVPLKQDDVSLILLYTEFRT